MHPLSSNHSSLIEANGYKVVLEKLLQRLSATKPTTRNPLQEMHTYVARKPLNIVTEIVEVLSASPGDIVLDGFMGSGTTLYAALSTARRAVGVDLSKLACRVVEATIKRYDLETYDALIEELFTGVFAEIDRLWRTKCPHCGMIAEIEREFFSIVTDNERPRLGRLQLRQLKYHCPHCNPGRQTYSVKSADRVDVEFLEGLQDQALRAFERFDVSLIHNTRIAIQEGSTLADYFSYRGMLSVSLLIQAIEDLPNVAEKELVWVTLSSAIHLIKLSDWKGSTQIPYWRPKSKFTGRNPRKFFSRSYKRVRKAKNYALENFKGDLHPSFKALTRANSGAFIQQGSIVEVLKQLPEASIDLIVTDPPYSDQVPYLEYSALWDALLDLENLTEDQLNKEIVVSDSPQRRKDEAEFYRLLSEAVAEMGRVLKPRKFAAVFYHEFSIRAWRVLIEAAQAANLSYLCQLNVGRQHRSLKNVLNPQQTLDGNSLVLFVKDPMHRDYSTLSDIKGVLSILDQVGTDIINRYGGAATSQQLYDEGVLSKIVELGALRTIEERYDTLLPLFKELFNFSDGYWRVRTPPNITG